MNNTLVEISRSSLGLDDPINRGGGKAKPILAVVDERGCHICISHARQSGYPVLRVGHGSNRRLVSIARLLLTHNVRPLEERELSLIHI